MASRRKNDQDLFGKEQKVLEQIEDILEKGPDQNPHEIWSAYETLSKQYESLLKVSIKLTKVSDATQRKLMHAKEEINRRTEELALKNQALYHTSVTDHLTSVFNRMYLMDVFQKEFATSQRQARPLSCAIMDIDKFKDFNDQYGHQTGDFVLKETARTIGSNLRENDIFGRYGGEEFFLILAGTPLEKAEHVAEKIRKTIAETTFATQGLNLNVTLSFGVADMTVGTPTSTDEIIRNADQALYEAKRKGRNRVELFDPGL